MGKVKDTFIALNGKKLPITAIFMVVASFVTLQAQVRTNTDNLSKVEQAPIHIAEIQKDVENIKEDIQDFKTEQREMRKDVKDILKALK